MKKSHSLPNEKCPNFLIVFAFLSVLLMPFLEGRANSLVPPAVNLDPKAPSLPNPDTAKPIDKLRFAAASLAWATHDHPVHAFSPDPSGMPTPVEWQMYEVLAVLDTVPNGPGDEEKQADQMKDAAWEALKALITEGPAAAAKGLIPTVLGPTVVSDGQGPTRDALKGWVMNQLLRYGAKGALSPFSMQKMSERFSQQPQSPSMTAKTEPATNDAVLQMFRDAESIRQQRIAAGSRIWQDRVRSTNEMSQIIQDRNDWVAKKAQAQAAINFEQSILAPLAIITPTTGPSTPQTFVSPLIPDDTPPKLREPSQPSNPPPPATNPPPG